MRGGRIPRLRRRQQCDRKSRAGADSLGIWVLGPDRGFDISQTLIEYSSRGSTYGRAFWVGLLNTLLVAGIGIVFATILGFHLGISRLSSNWLLAKAAGCYVELIRNLPLLLQLLFWYNAVLKTLPDIRDSISIGWRHLSQQSRLVSADSRFSNTGSAERKSPCLSEWSAGSPFASGHADNRSGRGDKRRCCGSRLRW